AARLPPGGPGEIGALTDSLNAMLAALARAQATERRFLADASHELRTPVTALAGNAEYLARHGADPGVVADLRADAARMARLVDDLLALERGRAGEGSATNAVVDLAALARTVAAGRARVRVHAPGPASMRGDAGALERALANLVENALVHGPPEGTVHVTVSAADGRVTVEVRDEGAGLDADAAAHAFDRFWRGPAAVADARPGAGLGLAIVRAAARAHGGDVGVDGSRFTLTLPAATDGRSSETPHDRDLV
ncbi:MAG: histidine kinase, partial [Solirubrobacterales bacterium]|nr:histidine kinase [Solirubrobacterales bacterium]